MQLAEHLVVIGAVVALTAIASACGANGAESGLVAHYSLDEGRGDTAVDASGCHNDAKIHGATWVEVPGGYALEFDGTDDYVDCGDPECLDLRAELTMMAWVCPAGRQIAREPAIFGKGFDSYLVTHYMDRDVYGYIGGGARNVHAAIVPRRWAHLAVTCAGSALKLYVNGTLVAERALDAPGIPRGGNFLIGALMNEPTGSDSQPQVDAAFRGLIDEVKVYNRALATPEIAAQFAEQNRRDRNAIFATPCAPIIASQRLRQGKAAVAVGSNGGMQIDYGSAFCVMDSQFSYPGEHIGWNALSEHGRDAESDWKPRLKKVNSSTVLLQARCAAYGLRREIRLSTKSVVVADTLTNLTDEPVGVIIRHRIAAPRPMTNALVGNSAAVPLIFFSQPGADFGIVAQDDIGRLQFDSSCVANTAEVRHGNFALAPRKSYTFRYLIYFLDATGDVYNLVNRVRRDWKANFTIEGPFQFMDAPSVLRQPPSALRAEIERKHLGMVALAPFLDYDPGSMNHVISRDEYRTLAREAARVLRRAKPGLKVLGCIETDWVTIYPDRMKDGHLIANGTPEQIARVIDQGNLPWRDSIKRDRDGHVRIEYYTRGGKPQFALGVYPAPGNFQHKFLLEQARFIMDDAGLDGFYIDEFSQGWGAPIRDYGTWDGFSADVDTATGAITGRFTDCGLVGIKPRLDLIRAAIGRGKTIVANTFATSTREQALPAQRFAETQGSASLDLLQPGRKPPFVDSIFTGVLGSPIGLGVTPSSGKPDLAQGLMLALVSYLRHGLLYYHYVYPALPKSGRGAGEYGPINHMFPLTPVELHQGWVKGRERIIAATSFQTDWRKATRPRGLFFDLHGGLTASAGKLRLRQLARGHWRVKVTLNDWNEIAVIE